MADIVVKLSDGENVIEELTKVAEKHKIEYGLYTSVSGKIKNFDLLSMQDRGKVNRDHFGDAAALNSISGKIQKTKDGYVNDINISVVKSGFSTIAGKLVKGFVAESLEVGIRSIAMNKIIEA